MKDKCSQCKKEIEEDEFAWFYIGKDGYEPGTTCICNKCIEQLGKDIECLKNQVNELLINK